MEIDVAWLLPVQVVTLAFLLVPRFRRFRRIGTWTGALQSLALPSLVGNVIWPTGTEMMALLTFCSWLVVLCSSVVIASGYRWPSRLALLAISLAGGLLAFWRLAGAVQEALQRFPSRLF